AVWLLPNSVCNLLNGAPSIFFRRTSLTLSSGFQRGRAVIAPATHIWRRPSTMPFEQPCSLSPDTQRIVMVFHHRRPSIRIPGLDGESSPSPLRQRLSRIGNRSNDRIGNVPDALAQIGKCLL